MPGPELAGLNILVTRPLAQAVWLSEQIRQRGGIPLALPLLKIHPQAMDDAMSSVLAQLPEIDLLIFISANAVNFGLAVLPRLPATLQVGAIGEATANQLREAGVQVDLVPAHFDSEGLLALPQLQDLQGKRVMIVRGVGGREKLADALRKRGAELGYLEVYRRSCPQWDADAVDTALRADIISVTSGEALDNLATLASLPGAEALWRKPLMVFHERIAVRAHELGFTLKPVVTAKASDAALLSALLHWANERKGMERA